MMIREMQKDDIPAVMELWLETNCRAHAFIPAEYWKSNVPYVTEALQQAEVYVYENQDEILGFAGINDTYIEGIFVKRDAQSKGIGTELLHFLKRQKETLQLSVYAKNTKAIAFYKHNGFTITSTGLDEDTNEQDYLMTWQRQ